MADAPTGRTVPMPEERRRLRNQAIDLIALLCFHRNDLAIAIIMSFLRALALRTAARVDVILGVRGVTKASLRVVTKASSIN
jgi:hypothetical protein